MSIPFFCILIYFDIPCFFLISEYLLSKGVDCFHDNIKLVTTCHIIFLCVLPSHIPAIADEIKMEIPPTLFIYSFASSVSARRLRQLFVTTNIIHPEYIFDEKHLDLYWDNTVNVNAALENKETVSATCPLKKMPGNFFPPRILPT